MFYCYSKIDRKVTKLNLSFINAIIYKMCILCTVRSTTEGARRSVADGTAKDALDSLTYIDCYCCPLLTTIPVLKNLTQQIHTMHWLLLGEWEKAIFLSEQLTSSYASCVQVLNEIFDFSPSHFITFIP